MRRFARAFLPTVLLVSPRTADGRERVRRGPSSQPGSLRFQFVGPASGGASGAPAGRQQSARSLSRRRPVAGVCSGMLRGIRNQSAESLSGITQRDHSAES